MRLRKHRFCGFCFIFGFNLLFLYKGVYPGLGLGNGMLRLSKGVSRVPKGILGFLKGVARVRFEVV
jgi:hypothetical protein